MINLTTIMTRLRFVFLASNVAAAVILGLTNARAVMDLGSIPFAEHGTIPSRQKTIKR
jgi:hypothetical protein